MTVIRSLFNSKASFKQQLLMLFFASLTCLAITTSTITAWQTSIELRKSTIETGLQISNNLADRLILALLTASKENAHGAITNTLGFKSVDSISVYKDDASLLVYNSKNESKASVLAPNIELTSSQLYQETELTWTFFAPVKYTEETDDMELIEPAENSQKEQTLGYVLVKYNKQALHAIQRSIVILSLIHI